MPNQVIDPNEIDETDESGVSPDIIDQINTPSEPEEPQEPSAGQQIKDRIVEEGKDRAKQWVRDKVKEKLKQQIKKKIEEEVVKKVEKEVVKQVVKQGAMQAVRTAAVAAWDAIVVGATAVFEAIGGWVPTLIIIGVVLIIVIIIVIVILLGANANTSGGTGAGVPVYPNEAQYKDAVALMAISGSDAAKRETLINKVTEMKAVIEKIKIKAKEKYDQAKADALIVKLDALSVKLDGLTTTTNQAEILVSISEIKNIIIQLGKDYPEVIFAGGNCADLQKYIDDGSFTFTHSEDKNLISKGFLKRSNGDKNIIPANPNLCSVLLFMLDKGVKLNKNNGILLTYGHTQYVSGTSTPSQHYRGEALDIGNSDPDWDVDYNGDGKKGNETITIKSGHSGSNVNVPADIVDVQSLLYDNAINLNIYQIWGPAPNKWWTKCSSVNHNIGGHDNHIHLGVIGGDGRHNIYKGCVR